MCKEISVGDLEPDAQEFLQQQRADEEDYNIEGLIEDKPSGAKEAPMEQGEVRALKTGFSMLQRRMGVKKEAY